jgi:hypothetical protein
MKRRDFLAGASAVAGSMLPGTKAMAADPCPPPQLSVEGGTSESSPACGPAGASTGLDFRGNASTTATLRFRFTNPLAIYPATYIWKLFPRRQAGYYTTFFWGNDDGNSNLQTFIWDNGKADSYYGAHPYPNPPPSGTSHNWEISVEQDDYQNGAVTYDRWHTQALRVWRASDGTKHHEFFWDWPNTDSSRKVVRVSPATWGNKMPPFPTLTWGDAPWSPSSEILNGVLRGIQIYADVLTPQDIASELASPRSTAAGAASIWYLNINPTPTDITDKSGKGHNPSWVGSERPGLWNA